MPTNSLFFTTFIDKIQESFTKMSGCKEKRLGCEKQPIMNRRKNKKSIGKK